MSIKVDFRLPDYYAKILLFLSVAAFSAGCAVVGSGEEPADPESSITWGEQRAINADVFGRQGQYEKDSSFARRQAAEASADKFFEGINNENCVIKTNTKNVCYRAYTSGNYERYVNGVAEADGLWKRHHDAFCIDNSCQPVDVHRLQTYEEYQLRYTGAKPDTETKTTTTLQAERVELVVRSMACYLCRRDRWQSSIAKISQFEPKCAAKHNIHKSLHGTVGINKVEVAVSDTHDSKGNNFLAVAEIADPVYTTRAKISTFSAEKPGTEIQKTPACYSRLDLVKRF